DKALQYCEQVLPILQELFGERHPETANSLNNIGVVYDNKGEYDKALQYFEQALSIRQESLEEGHPSTILALNNIAEMYDKMGNLGKAAEYRALVEQVTRTR
ncbi:MAG: tetratricopeptide repeat protein, partial [Candidatus Cloacimonetes bacterium]|nr:tetratricopeptide repeat protein [Candidatus Cloacimonadota bacterium]